MDPLQKSVVQKTYRLTVSPLQWGVCPGNIRFTLLAQNGKISAGGISIGGMAAYMLQRMIVEFGPVNARVLRSAGSHFVLSALETTSGFKPWKDALYAEPVSVEKVEVSARPISLPVSRKLASPMSAVRPKIAASI